MSELSVVYRAPGELHPYQRNARKHSRKQIAQISASIKRFGFTNPILIDDADCILAGHGRLEAAKAIGMPAVPTIRLSEMTDGDRRAYVIADNRLALNAGWDYEILAGEMQGLIDLGFDIELTGFRWLRLISPLNRQARQIRCQKQTRRTISRLPKGLPSPGLAMSGN